MAVRFVILVKNRPFLLNTHVCQLAQKIGRKGDDGNCNGQDDPAPERRCRVARSLVQFFGAHRFMLVLLTYTAQYTKPESIYLASLTATG